MCAVQVGWFPTYTITEDYALSQELKMAGFKGRYLPEYLAVSWGRVVCTPCRFTAALIELGVLCTLHHSTLPVHSFRGGLLHVACTPKHCCKALCKGGVLSCVLCYAVLCGAAGGRGS